MHAFLSTALFPFHAVVEPAELSLLLVLVPDLELFSTELPFVVPFVFAIVPFVFASHVLWFPVPPICVVVQTTASPTGVLSNWEKPMLPQVSWRLKSALLLLVIQLAFA